NGGLGNTQGIESRIIDAGMRSLYRTNASQSIPPKIALRPGFADSPLGTRIGCHRTLRDLMFGCCLLNPVGISKFCDGNVTGCLLMLLRGFGFQLLWSGWRLMILPGIIIGTTAHEK